MRLLIWNTHTYSKTLWNWSRLHRSTFLPLNSKLFANQMERSVMYWHVSLGLYNIQEFGKFQVLGCMLKIPSQYEWGASGYMLRRYLLTPYRQPTSTTQSTYNYAHKGTRVIIEQTFGRWKRRFHCLHGEVRINPDKVCSIIISCAVFHNIAIQ